METFAKGEEAYEHMVDEHGVIRVEYYADVA